MLISFSTRLQSRTHLRKSSRCSSKVFCLETSCTSDSDFPPDSDFSLDVDFSVDADFSVDVDFSMDPDFSVDPDFSLDSDFSVDSDPVFLSGTIGGEFGKLDISVDDEPSVTSSLDAGTDVAVDLFITSVDIKMISVDVAFFSIEVGIKPVKLVFICKVGSSGRTSVPGMSTGSFKSSVRTASGFEKGEDSGKTFTS